MPISFIPAIIGTAILAPALAARRRISIINATNTTLTLTSPVTAALPANSAPLIIEGQDAASQIDGTFEGVPAGIGQEVVGAGSVVVDSEAEGEGMAVEDVKESSMRLKATSKQEMWGLIISSRNASGVWPHATAADGENADVTFWGEIDIDDGGSTDAGCYASTALVLSVDEASGTFDVEYKYGQPYGAGFNVQPDPLNRDRARRCAVRNGEAIHAMDTIGAIRRNIPLPDSILAPNGNSYAITPGDIVADMKNSGGDVDSVTWRLYYIVSDDG